ncbi:GDSL-like Lipase/Acylhydrolase family protein [Microbacterium sp. cf046]|uniref:GDSL-type esterase/lipase family protein n=1 Tax=Microbacterium sp. cf046 TaxID=1761803 RepID=UPI0008E7F4DE|nr:GDSL-type esterase/lipase family protein [Microbacterium sp. cf046]SFR93437.1 GDSL-like Lipase/Acylhydrolase family protein [Microbacterium sp. cf046]
MVRTVTFVAAFVAATALVSGGALSASAAEGDAQEVYHVVQMGDSYSAGNGAGDYYGDPAAYRSHRSWANLYADWLADQPNLPVQYVSYAHSGAETSDILSTQLPQVSADTDLVMFTIGGNDVGFATIVEDCFLVGYRSADGCRTSVDTAVADLPAVATATRQILDELAAKLSPDAQIVILGYPLLSTDTPYILCDYHVICWGSYEYDAAANVRQLGLQANALQDTVVAQYNAQPGVPQAIHVTDIHDLFAGHEPAPGTSNDYRWVDEFLETETVQDPPGFVAQTDYSYSADKFTFWHPGITGHAQEAQHLAAQLGLLPRALAIQAANAGAPENPAGATPPTAWLAGPYVRTIGDSIEFDARGSAAGGGRITQYEWDFDGDGVFDETTAAPHATAAYSGPAEVDVAVRVTQTDGQSATTTTEVHISSDGDSTPEELDNCPAIYNYSQTDLDGDGTGDDCDDSPGHPTGDAASLYFHGPDGVLQRVGVDPADVNVVPADSEGTSVTLGAGTLTAGQTVTVTASGFVPGDTADVWIASDPIVLETSTISDAGTLTATVQVPADIEPGAHRIYVTAPATVASAPVTITAGGADSGSTGQLAASGGQAPIWPMAVGLLAVCAGLALAWIGRVRRVRRR